MTFVINEFCIDAKSQTCVPVCPVDCIYEGPRMLYINPTECIDCGACERECPERAIDHITDLADDQQRFARINRQFFDEIGNPFGARKFGVLDFDHPEVAAVPSP